SLRKIGAGTLALAGTTNVTSGVLITNGELMIPGGGVLNLTGTPIVGRSGTNNTFAQNGNRTSGNVTISGLSSTASIVTGLPVSGTGIPGGATVASIVDGTTITISAPATSSGTNTVTFPSTTITGLSTTADLAVDMLVTGLGIPSGATIASILNGTTIVLNTATTSAGAAPAVASLNFTPAVEVRSGTLSGGTGTVAGVINGAVNVDGTLSPGTFRHPTPTSTSNTGILTVNSVTFGPTGVFSVNTNNVQP